MVSQFFAGRARPPGCNRYSVALPAPKNRQLSELSALIDLVAILPTQARLAAQRRQLNFSLSQLNQISSNLGRDHSSFSQHVAKMPQMCIGDKFLSHRSTESAKILPK